MRIIGIDPGYKKTGFGIIDEIDKKFSYIISGCIYSDRLNILECFKNIFNDLVIILKKYKPDILVIENIFIYKNRTSILKLAQVRGSIISAAALLNIKIIEFSPKKVKKVISGYGFTEKNEVKFFVKKVLRINFNMSEDSTDALAVAICYNSSL